MLFHLVSVDPEVVKKRVYSWKKGLLEREGAGGQQVGGGARAGAGTGGGAVGVARGRLGSGCRRRRGE